MVAQGVRVNVDREPRPHPHGSCLNNAGMPWSRGAQVVPASTPRIWSELLEVNVMPKRSSGCCTQQALRRYVDLRQHPCWPAASDRQPGLPSLEPRVGS